MARRVVALLAVVSALALGFSALTRTERSASLGPSPSASDRDEREPGLDDIDGVEWKIVGVDGRPLGDDRNPWFQVSTERPDSGQFLGDSTDGNVFVSGDDGCNSYWTRGDFRDGRLTVAGGGIMTLVACPPPLVGLPGDARFVLLDDWLLVEGSPTLLAFDRATGRPETAPPVIVESVSTMPRQPLSTVAIGTEQHLPAAFDTLVGTRWILASHDGEPWSSSLTPSFTIGSGVNFSGHDGCNRYVGNWWLDADELLVRSDESEPLPCRATVPDRLRPASGFRFTLDGDIARSGPLGAREPYVTFQRLPDGGPVVEPSQLTGTWRTADGITVEFSPTSQIIVGDCGAVARWTLRDQLAVERLWEPYQRCDEVTSSPSFAMLLLDSRPSERLEILDDGTLVHTSDSALTLLLPT